MSDITEQIRDSCQWVAARARYVRIEHDAIPPYAAGLPLDPPPPAGTFPGAAEREERAARSLTLDAINFGSGWFPTLRKRPGLSGYRTIEQALGEHFDRHGPWRADELARIGAEELARTLGQDPRHELMALFARSLNDLGEHLAHEHEGCFSQLIEHAGGSAVALAEHLADWDCFADSSTYRRRTVPFLKRAQIAASGLQRAGAVRFDDLARLTMFADNLVPHVLRLDGVLRFAPELVDRIDREALIEHGSPEEVEIRACALHAVELIVQARPETCAADVDWLLWERGAGARYKASPRHRSRCTAY